MILSKSDGAPAVQRCFERREGVEIHASVARLQQSFGVRSGLVRITRFVAVGGVRRNRDDRFPSRCRQSVCERLHNPLVVRARGIHRLVAEIARLSERRGRTCNRSSDDRRRCAGLSQKLPPVQSRCSFRVREIVACIRLRVHDSCLRSWNCPFRFASNLVFILAQRKASGQCFEACNDSKDKCEVESWTFGYPAV